MRPRPKFEMYNLTPFGLRLISFWFSSLAEALLWFWFTLLFCCNFFLLHFSCCFAWYLASHTQIPIFPNATIPSPPSLSHRTPTPTTPPITDAPELLSRQRSLIDEEHGRCSPLAKQTRRIWPPTWQRTGTGAQCRYTPLTWSTNSPYPVSMESDLSHRT